MTFPEVPTKSRNIILRTYVTYTFMVYCASWECWRNNNRWDWDRFI